MKREEVIEEARAGLAAFDEYWGAGAPVNLEHGRPWELIRGLLSVFEKALTPTDDERKLARAMARVEQLSDHLGIPYVYETGHGPVRPTTALPVYLAADLWDALGAPAGDFDAYYERNRWADTWSNLLGTVRDRFRPKCGQDTEGEPCVLTAGHLPPHYGPSDVGSHEPVPVPEPQGEPSDAALYAAFKAFRAHERKQEFNELDELTCSECGYAYTWTAPDGRYVVLPRRRERHIAREALRAAGEVDR